MLDRLPHMAFVAVLYALIVAAGLIPGSPHG